MPPITYQDAGVDITAGNEFVERIKPLVQNTMRPECIGGIGGFGGLFDISKTERKHPILVAATDGVGTKLKLAIAADNHKTIGIDLVAMCVNDLIVQGAEPLFFLDYMATGKLDKDAMSDIVASIAAGCSTSGCALIGGETAEMPGMYADKHYDLAGFAVGVVDKEAMLPRQDIEEGDVLIGLASSGVHSNGYSLVRLLLEQHNIALEDKAPFDSSKTIGEILLTPTKLYIKSLLPLINQGKIKALSHITGGGLLENIPRILPERLSAHIDKTSWQVPALFSWLQKLGSIEEAEMFRSFNCGIGMVAIVAKDQAEDIAAALNEAGEQSSIMGHITTRDQEAVVIQ